MNVPFAYRVWNFPPNSRLRTQKVWRGHCVRSPAELTLSSYPNHGQLMLKFYKKKYSVMLYIFHKNALLTSNFNENFLGAINAPFPPIYFVWKVDTAHFSAFRCVYFDVSNIWPKPRSPTPRVLVDIHWKVEHLSYTYIQEKRCNHSEDFRLRCLTFTSIYSREMKSPVPALGLALLLSLDLLPLMFLKKTKQDFK